MAESSGESQREEKCIRVGILTVSDSCYEGRSDDRSGGNLKHLIEDKELLNAEVSVKEIVPDEAEKIRNVLTAWTDNLKLDLIVSTGGTGFSARDVTPEATKSVLDRDALGITVAMLTGSLNITPLAMLSRLTCGIRKSTLIINLPGSTKGAEECFRFAVVGVSHAVDQLRASSHNVKKTHQDLQGEVTHTNEPGQFQPMSDESMDSNSVENFDQSPEISDSSMHAEFHEAVTFDSLNNRETSISIPDSIVQCHNLETETHGSIVSNVHTGESVNSDKGDNSHSDFSQLCFHAEQSNSNLPGEPLTVISLVTNAAQVLHHQPVYEKADKDIIDLFQFQGSYGEPSQPVLFCKPQKIRPASEINEVQEVVTLATVNDLVAENIPTTSTNDIYDFNEETDNQHSKARAGPHQTSTAPQEEQQPILRAKLHKTADEGEITLVDVGPAVKTYLWTHPALRGVYVNKGKRDVKRHLVRMRREDKAVDTGSWQRGGRIHDRNRLDDYFQLTEEGEERRKKVEKRVLRDEYVVNWYMWCPGHGNCRRKCGGYGRCVNGCKGKTHKQDRHNCSLLVNLKMFLSDTKKWRVQISGNHVPLESNILWEPPRQEAQRMNEDTRDILIASAMSQKPSTSQIQEALSKRPAAASEVPSKRKICRFVSSMRKRRRQKNYNCRDEDDVEEEVDGDRIDCEETEIESETVSISPEKCDDNSQDNDKDDHDDEDDGDKDDDVEEELINVEEVENKNGSQDDVNIENGEIGSNLALHGFQTISDSACLDETNIIPSVALFKMTDSAGNVYLCTGNVSSHNNTISHQGILGRTASSSQRDLVLARKPGHVAQGFVYTPSSDVAEATSAEHSSDLEASNCGDLGALIMAAYQQQ